MPLYRLAGFQPTLPPEGRYWIAPGAQVIGRVSLGEDVGVWFNAVIRGDNELIRIGARTNIQDGCVLHSDEGSPLSIGRDCTIGHGAIVHGCTVGDGCLIGMGATLLNGAVIGRGSLVGANALVTEGKIFPERSLIVGSPAKSVRTLDEAAVAKLLASAAYYAANWKRFAGGLAPIEERG
jgi:carbonic anhydrase/acetyltransferase-like protein (isoleucine patch superfamily)